MRSGDHRCILLNVALFKGFDILLTGPGLKWVRVSAIEGGSTTSYLIKVRLRTKLTFADSRPLES